MVIVLILTLWHLGASPLNAQPDDWGTWSTWQTQKGQGNRFRMTFAKNS